MKHMNNKGIVGLLIAIAITVLLMVVIGCVFVFAKHPTDFKSEANNNGFTIKNINYVSDKMITFVYSVDQQGLFNMAHTLGTTTIFYDTSTGGLNAQLYYFVTNGTTAWNYKP